MINYVKVLFFSIYCILHKSAPTKLIIGLMVFFFLVGFDVRKPCDQNFACLKSNYFAEMALLSSIVPEHLTCFFCLTFKQTRFSLHRKRKPITLIHAAQCNKKS